MKKIKIYNDDGYEETYVRYWEALIYFGISFFFGLFTGLILIGLFCWISK